MTPNIFGQFEMPCPGCGTKIRFHEKASGYGIEVNCETQGEVTVPRMLHLWTPCHNPLCKWSKVESSFITPRTDGI